VRLASQDDCQFLQNQQADSIAFSATSCGQFIDNRVGITHAASVVMARHVRELIVWQLADELRRGVFSLCKQHSALIDQRFRDQAQSAASGVAANIAEGFGRATHREFAQFLGYARASLLETEDWLRDGTLRGFWTDDETAESRTLCRRLTAGIGALRRYLIGKS
jgi:four helix bundle protein